MVNYCLSIKNALYEGLVLHNLDGNFCLVCYYWNRNYKYLEDFIEFS